MSKKVKDENKEYVSLPYFGINKLLPYLKPYRFILISMVTLGLLGGFVDIILPLFQRYALNYFIEEETLDTLAVFILCYAGILIFQVVANGNSIIFLWIRQFYISWKINTHISFYQVKHDQGKQGNQNLVKYLTMWVLGWSQLLSVYYL